MGNHPLLYFRKAGEGIPVVLLHGLFGMSDNCQSFAQKLAEKGYLVYTVDLRNHGRSFHDDVFNFSVMADDLLDVFEAEKIYQPVVAGHSLGGKVAMHLALHAPDRVSKLVVVDIAPRFYPVHHTAVLDALRAVDLTVIQTRKDAEGTLMKQSLDGATIQFLLKNLYWSDQRLAWRFNLPVIERNIGEVGKETKFSHPYSQPALFISGENSSYITDHDHAGILNLFPQAQIKTAPAAGHWVHADNPLWLLEEMAGFIAPGN